MNKVLETTKVVVENADWVQINREKLKIFARHLQENGLKIPRWESEFHLENSSAEAKLNYLFVVDALNFSFWPDEEKDRWVIQYQGKDYRGYYGLSMAIRRALENGISITDFGYLEDISLKDLEMIFDGQGKLPLMKERAKILKECAKIMRRRYNGQVRNLVESARGSAVQLAYRLAEEFPPFRDVADYKHYEVWLLKRAQIFAGDVWGCFNGRGIGAFRDIDKLTAFADYRVPQVLEYFGVLEYLPLLQGKVYNETSIPAGSWEEIEIRSATIWAVEYLKKELSHNLNSVKVDWLLWQMAQNLKLFLPPHHRTRTIFY